MKSDEWHLNDWSPYAPTQTINIGQDYKNYEIEFEMTKETDANSIFTISMVAVDRIIIDKLRQEIWHKVLYT